MPFTDDEPFYGPLAIPKGLDVTPEPEEYNNSVFGAAFRTENPIASAAAAFSFDPEKVIDPSFRPWEAVQGTKYEPYADRFVGAADSADIAGMKAQIDREMEDRAVLDAAGWAGYGAQMFAGLLSPTSLLPGGAIIKGAKGISIAKTGLSVGTSAATAAAIDEAFLHSTQATRTKEESALAIGGSFILGGLLGAAVGKLSQRELKAAGAQVEAAIPAIHDFNEALRAEGGSLSAASAKATMADLELRGEKVFQMVNNTPVLRGIVRSDPVLRGQISFLSEARRSTAALVETPLEYRINAEGQSVRAGNPSVETRVKERERTELSRSISGAQNAYAEYWKDGPVGSVGTFTAPITARFAHLLGRTEKLTSSDFMDEVGKALSSGDKHPIPQVQRLAETIRRDVFDKIKVEATELGIFDEGLKIDNADSYFSRVYRTELIAAHYKDGSANDISTVLKDEFSKRRGAAQKMIFEDDSLNMLEIDDLKLAENIRETKKALKKASEKARTKRSVAKAAMTREGAVGRVTGRLREVFANRQAVLEDGKIEPAARDALKEMLADARGARKLEPVDILGFIRGAGGIRDPRAGGRWAGATGWVKGTKPTELENILGDSARTVRRDDGLDLDYMREALEEAGYLKEASTVDDMLEAIRKHTQGEKVYSEVDALEVERFNAAMQFREDMAALGIDFTDPIDKIIVQLHGRANTPVGKAKAVEAGRAKNKASAAETAARKRALDAMDRLEEARARLDDLKNEVGPAMRQEIAADLKQRAKVRSMIRDAKKAREKEAFYANASDTEIDQHVEDAVRSILQMKPNESHGVTAFASPTRARTLDVADSVLEPWLEKNAEMILSQYHRSMVPQMEMIREFGDVNGSAAIDAIQEQAAREMQNASSAKERLKIKAEADNRVEDFEGMRDRILGRFGAPKNPRNGWVVGGRATRTLSYTGYLGGMTLSAMADVAGVIGRGGVSGAFGAAVTAITDPRRMFTASKDMAEIGASAEWYLNTRAISMSEMFDPYGRGTRLERTMAQGARHFSIMTGMIPWNVGWKSAGGAAVASRMSKAIDASAKGKASQRQLRILGSNGIEPWMADRIAKQLDEHGDKNGMIWQPRGQNWTDQEAFTAFRHAMNREFDLMVITPGQDKPLSFSTEFGKFFFQFKSFAVSAHHRILLAGLQRADADLLAQVTAAILLGGLVSNIKADLGGYDRKEGTAYWEDALDKSGLMGWLMEPYNALSTLTGGATSISGEPVSRFQSRSYGVGLLGPSVDMGLGVMEGTSAMASGQHSYKDIRKLMRPVPTNNLIYLLPLWQKVEDAMVQMTGAKPRE